MSFRRILSLIAFFFKTVYFSPFNNPSVFILAILVGIFFFTGGMGKHEVVLLVLIISISNRFVPAFRKRYDNGQLIDTTISQYFLILPIKSQELFLSYIITGIMYATVLLSLCYYIGINSENPPNIPSLCPTQTISKINPSSKEPYTTVFGVIALPDSANHIQLRLFLIPLNPSIIFGNLSSTVVIEHTKISDSVYCQLCIPEKAGSQNTNSSDFLGLKGKRDYYSDYLATLPEKHNRILIVLIILCFIIFIIEQINISRNGSQNLLTKSMDLLLYCSYFAVWLGLILDLLLPESSVFLISAFLLQFKLYLTASYYIIIFIGLVRIGFSIFYNIRSSESC